MTELRDEGSSDPIIKDDVPDNVKPLFELTESYWAIIERAKKALPQYQADCLSRRRGILQQCSFTVPHTPQPVTRTNINFSTLQKVATEYVCEL